MAGGGNAGDLVYGFLICTRTTVAFGGRNLTSTTTATFTYLGFITGTLRDGGNATPKWLF